MKQLITSILLFIVCISCVDQDLSNNKLSTQKINPPPTCTSIPEFEQSWVAFITEWYLVDGAEDHDSYAWAGVQSIYPAVLYGMTLEVYASDVQSTELPVPTLFTYMTDQPMGTVYWYTPLIENDFKSQWESTYGPISNSMSGKYMYVKMRLKNECDEYSEFIIVGVKINQLPGNLNCPNC